MPLISPEGKSSKGRQYQRCRTAPTARGYHNDFIEAIDSSSQTNNFKGLPHKPKHLHIFLVLFLYLGSGTLCFYLVRHQLKGKHTNGIIDALYFCIVTMTTLGYGDLVPCTILAKLLACFYVFIGMAIVGILLSKVADYIVERHEIALVNALNMQQSIRPGEIVKEVATHKTIKYKFLLYLAFLVLLMVSGGVVLTLVEKMTPLNAFYCVCATVTTLGNGDKSFSAQGGRVFAIFWILSGTICSVIGRKLALRDIQAADLDHNNVVSAAEFILYKLKEMDKIHESDIAPLMASFKSLDVDYSGTLTAADTIICNR